MQYTWLYSEHSFYVFRDILDQVADHVMVTDKNGLIEYVNPAFEKTTGYGKEEVLGKNPRILKSGQQSPEYYQSLWQTILGGEVFYAKTLNKKKNGELYVAEQTVSPIFNQFQEITHFVSIWRDITQTVKLQERLEFEKEKLEEIISFDEQLTRIRRSDQLIDFVVTKTKKILQVGKCAVLLVDKDTKQLYTKSRDGFEENVPMHINIPGSLVAEVVLVGKSLIVNNPENEQEFKDLKQLAYLGRSFMVSPIKLEEDVIGVIMVAEKHHDAKGIGFFDTVDLKILKAIATEMAVAIENVSFYKELHYLTVTDPLTHTHNYRHFVNSLEYEFKRLSRFQGDLCLLMMDIDGFKDFNDEFGHLEGDVLLKEISVLIHLNLREVDILCRYGGDEFVVILPGVDKQGALIVAEKIRESIENAKFLKPVTLSIGLSQYKARMTRYDLTF